jgi:hypothetical protein
MGCGSEKSEFSAYFIDLRENGARYRQSFYGVLPGNQGRSFQQQHVYLDPFSSNPGVEPPNPPEKTAVILTQ